MMNAAARPPTPAAPPTRSGAATTSSAVSTREEERRRRVLLQAAIDGNLDLLARMAVELEATARCGAAGVWSTCGRGALHLAAANGRTHVCQYLACPVDVPSTSGETPLLLAAESGHTATAAYLLERGADPRTAENDGETPLHWAAYNGDQKLAMLFLSTGADVGAANPRGTALHVAAARGHSAVVDVLLRHGADPNKVANRVFTPLVSSLLGGSLDCMKLLIQAGADVNAGGLSGGTPLLLACSGRGNIRFINCLLEAGADPNVPDDLGRLPIEITAVHAEQEVTEVLFYVTRCRWPPAMAEWSVAGIVRYVNSAAYMEWTRIAWKWMPGKDRFSLVRLVYQFLMHWDDGTAVATGKSNHVTNKQASCRRKDELKLQGNEAFKIKDYDAAILFYNMAMKFDNTDADLYSNRSLCWLHLGIGDDALSDAWACTRMKPDWAKGYYRQGMALCLLQDYAGASDALLRASKLDPENTMIADALRDVSERAKRVLPSPVLRKG